MANTQYELFQDIITELEDKVNLTDDQTISGVKDFSSNPTVNGSAVLNSSSGVTLDTEQTISGAKNFSSNPTVNGSAVLNSSSGVTLDTEQSITGLKNFTGGLQSNGSNVVDSASTQTITGSKDFTGGLKNNGSDVVDLASTQTITALKNFTGGLAVAGNTILIDNNIALHNAIPRCKYLGDSITDAQNTAIKNRTYDDLFIGDYWTIGGINWRIVAVDYYYNVGDTAFTQGNVLVMPDTVLYNAQMNTSNSTTGGYAGSTMRSTNLASAKSTASSCFGSHVASHRVLLCNAVDSSTPSGWTWLDSAGVELPNEVQIYGSRAWSSPFKPFDMGSQFTRLPLFNSAINFISIRADYWLQDVSSGWVGGSFAVVSSDGLAGNAYASDSLGVRPVVTLTYI